jgi:uncharacterized membrane protein
MGDRPAMTTSRLEAFSDGVFAIAITLLVLEFRVPDGDGTRLGHDLIHLWPSALAYVVSFGTIGVIWVNHHAIIDRVSGADRVLLFLNLLLMATVAFIPFPTSVLARHLGGPGDRAAAVFFASSLLLMAVGFAVVNWHALRAGLFVLSPLRAPKGWRVLNYGLVFYPIAIALGLVSPVASVLVCIGVAVYYGLPPRLAGRAE